MHISNNLRKYVRESIQVSKSNVIITDLEKVNLIDFIETPFQYSISNYFLSTTVKKLLQTWITSNVTQNDLFVLLNGKDCINILEDDSIPYSCQIIFPIFVRNNLEGLLILFRTHNDYVASSINSLKNFKEFVTDFINDTYNEGGKINEKDK